MENAYEMIEYDGTNFNFRLASETYVIPHLHKEIELGMIIDGSVELIMNGMHQELHPGDFWLINTCQSHEMCSVPRNKPYVFVVLQLKPDFFHLYYPQFEKYRFDQAVLNEESMGEELYRSLRYDFLKAAISFYKGEERYELICISHINLIFCHILAAVLYHEVETEEYETDSFRALRIQRIYQYIEDHSAEKLLLSDIADEEGLTMTYLSHFFTDNFGIPFQTYLSRVRCKKARNLLRSTNLSLTEISIVCGFSAVKYLNKGFEELYCCTPMEYRAVCMEENANADVDEEITQAEVDLAMDALAEDETSIESTVTGTMSQLAAKNQVQTPQRRNQIFTDRECVRKLKRLLKKYE